MSIPKIIGKKTQNIARPKPISERQSKAIADSQIWQREFRTDYNQIVLRISYSTGGLYYGAPPGRVT